MANCTPIALELEPGRRAGPFVLGADLRDVLALLRTGALRTTVTDVALKYDAGARRDTDLLLDIPRHGVLLRFAQHTQRLVAIEVYAFHAVRLAFAGEVLTDPPPTPCPYPPSPSPSSASPAAGGAGANQQQQQQQHNQQQQQQGARGDVVAPLADSVYFQSGAVEVSPAYEDIIAQATRAQYRVPTFVEIYRLFRPTYPGTYRDLADGRVLYTLRYPGIAFVFEIPERWRGLARTKDHPIEFPDKTSASVLRVVLAPAVPEDQEQQEQQEEGNSHKEEEDAALGVPLCPRRRMEVRFGRGLALGDGGVLAFGDSAQDVVAALGEPDSQYLKQAGPMRGFGGSSSTANGENSSNAGTPPPDVFFNYFGYGLDVLLDGTRFVVKKFVLHANHPHHKDFGRYSKALWRARAAPDAPAIDVDSTWAEVRAALAPARPSGEPLVNSASSADSPFGTTFFHAYESQGAVFEVMQNDRVATMAFFPAHM